MIAELLSQRKLPELKTREEMLDSLLQNEYGYLPPMPDSLEWVTERLPCSNDRVEWLGVTAVCTMAGKSFSFPFKAVIPAEGKKIPFVVHIRFGNAIPGAELTEEEAAEEAVRQGFAMFCFNYTDVTADNGDFTDGLAGILYENGKRTAEQAGKPAIWAWAAQRVLDFAHTLSDRLDLSCAAVCGHSRLGKTALVSAASDTRWAFCYSNNSGCSGAALSRDKVGESKERICQVFPYWFCENYLNSDRDAHGLPLDQHYLLAAIAPRYVLVGSASEDEWADPKSEFLCCAAASPAYQALDLPGLISEDSLPGDNECRMDGRIGYHIRPGKHFFGVLDWQRMLQFILAHRT